MRTVATLILCILLVACADKPAPTQPVPIGDKAALKSLAAEYNKLSEHLTVSPWNLPASDRKKFLVKVFAASGYSYSATLHKMAEGGWDGNDQNVKDLVELLFMPHTDMHSVDSLSGVYSDQEMADVRKVQAMMPQ